jgi:hypothetical protein
MQCNTFVMMAAVVGLVGVAVGSAQTGAAGEKTAGEKTTVQKKAVTKERVGAGRLQLENLPAAVRATIDAEAKNATLKGLKKEKENGRTVYELETLINGRTRDLMIDAAGKVYEVEEQLDPAKAPAPVRAALAAVGTIVALETVWTKRQTHYEGQVRTRAGKRVSLALDADGKPFKK